MNRYGFTLTRWRGFTLISTRQLTAIFNNNLTFFPPSTGKVFLFFYSSPFSRGADFHTESASSMRLSLDGSQQRQRKLPSIPSFLLGDTAPMPGERRRLTINPGYIPNLRAYPRHSTVVEATLGSFLDLSFLDGTFISLVFGGSWSQTNSRALGRTFCVGRNLISQLTISYCYLRSSPRFIPRRHE
jgi:hypothetical protein